MSQRSTGFDYASPRIQSLQENSPNSTASQSDWDRRVIQTHSEILKCLQNAVSSQVSEIDQTCDYHVSSLLESKNFSFFPSLGCGPSSYSDKASIFNHGLIPSSKADKNKISKAVYIQTDNLNGPYKSSKLGLASRERSLGVIVCQMNRPAQCPGLVLMPYNVSSCGERIRNRKHNYAKS